MAAKQKALNGRIPETLYLKLERLRHRRSVRERRRVTQRELLVEALEALTALRTSSNAQGLDAAEVTHA